MRKTTTFVLSGVALAMGGTFLGYCAQQHQIIVDADVRRNARQTVRSLPLAKVDHSCWDKLLRKYVDQDGMVNYAAWKASASDRAALKHYLATLGNADPKAPTNKEGKLAYWINVYNALTVHGGSTPQNALASLAEYMPNVETSNLIKSRDFTVSYLDYDWSLNEQ